MLPLWHSAELWAYVVSLADNLFTDIIILTKWGKFIELFIRFVDCVCFTDEVKILPFSFSIFYILYPILPETDFF